MRPLTIAAAFVACSGCSGAGDKVTIDVILESPVAGTPVFLQDADGEVKLRTETDSNGRAVLGGVVAGDMATVVRHQDSATLGLLTVTDLRPGDEILVGIGRSSPTTPLGTLTVTLPADPPGEGALSLAIGGTAAGCSSPATCEADIFSSHVDGDGRIGVVATVTAPGGTIAFSHARVAPDPSGQTVVTLPPWRTDLGTLDVTIDGAAGWTGIHLEPSLTRQAWHGSYGPLVLDATSTRRVQVRYPAGFGDVLFVDAVASDGRPYGRGRSELLFTLRSPAPSSLEIDLASALPYVFDTLLTGRQVTFGTSGAVTGAGLLIVDTSWGSWETGSRALSWYLMAPAQAAQPVDYPPIPDELSAWSPESLTVSSGPWVTLYDASGFAGYRELVNRVGLEPSTDFWHPSPVPGAVRALRTVAPEDHERILMSAGGPHHDGELGLACSQHPIDPDGYGACGDWLGYGFDGIACQPVTGCQGDVDLHATLEECARAAAAADCCPVDWPVPPASCTLAVACFATAADALDHWPDAVCTENPGETDPCPPGAPVRCEHVLPVPPDEEERLTLCALAILRHHPWCGAEGT